jgi:hypothetical protein
VLDQPDERLRGIAIFAAGSVDRARELANTDPAELRSSVFNWSSREERGHEQDS